MIDRTQITRFLKLNGINIDAPDEQIKSILLSAKWHKDDVETALTVLRENTSNNETHVDTLHKVFRSDEKLKPETITALLGIDVDISAGDVSLSRKRASAELTTGMVINILLVSLLLSTMFLLGSMYFFRVGIFHPSITSL